MRIIPPALILIARATDNVSNTMFRKDILLSEKSNLRDKNIPEIYPRAKGISLRLFWECPKKVGDIAKRRITMIPVL